MSLTALFVRRPTLVFVLLALVAVAGGMAWQTLVRQQFPNVSQPTVGVSVTYTGASPTVMRDSIVRPIEDQIAGQPDLQTINSTFRAGRYRSPPCSRSPEHQHHLTNVLKAVKLRARRSLRPHGADGGCAT